MPFIYEPFKGIEKLFIEKIDKADMKPQEYRAQLSQAIIDVRNLYNNDQIIAFTSDIQRLAYMIQYYPIGINYIHNLIVRLCANDSCILPRQLSCFWRNPLNVLSIGAGPGTDLIGIVSNTMVCHERINYTCIDLDAEWVPYHQYMWEDYISQASDFNTPIVNNKFIPRDLNEIAQMGIGEYVNNADIIIVNRVLSHFKNVNGKSTEIIKYIASDAHDDAVVIMLDIPPAEGSSWDKELAHLDDACRAHKHDSKWLLSLQWDCVQNFGWLIPKTIMELESDGTKITRSGEYVGGIILIHE